MDPLFLVFALAGAASGYAVRTRASQLAGVTDRKLESRFFWFEILTALAFMGVHARFGFTLSAFTWYAFVLLLAAVTATDLLVKLIPDKVTLGGAAIGVVCSIAFPKDIHGFFNQGALLDVSADAVGGFVLSLTGMVAGFLALEGIRRGMGALAGMDVMGMGDSKLIGLMGAFLGPKLVLFALVPGVLCGLVIGIVYTKLKNSPHFPFGPALGLGGLIALLWGDELAAECMSAVRAMSSMGGAVAILLQLVLLGIAISLMLRVRRRRAQYEAAIEADYAEVEGGGTASSANDDEGSRRIATSKRYFEFANAGDVDALLTMYAPDATFVSSEDGVVHRGKEAIDQMMRALFARFPGAHWTVEDYNEDTKGAVSFDFEMTATDESGATVKRHGHERLEFNQKGQIRSASVKLKS
ncbi:MAG: nuclear transport factor 2 family protein [Planctomycetota bacterium]